MYLKAAFNFYILYYMAYIIYDGLLPPSPPILVHLVHSSPQCRPVVHVVCPWFSTVAPTLTWWRWPEQRPSNLNTVPPVIMTWPEQKPSNLNTVPPLPTNAHTYTYMIDAAKIRTDFKCCLDARFTHYIHTIHIRIIHVREHQKP